MSEHPRDPDAPMSDDDVLRYTQARRKEFLEEVFFKPKEDGGLDFPADTKEQSIMLAAMADMDRTAVNNKRIGVSEKQAANDSLVARTLARLGRDFGGRNPFEGNDQPVVDQARLPKVNESALPPAEAVPGEKDIGLSEDSFDGLMKRHDEGEA